MLKAIEKYKSRYMTPENYPWVADMVRDIEQEIAERYIELPLDADGVPIHVGDKMEREGQQFIVCAIAPAVIHSWAARRKLGEGLTTVGYRPEDCRHIKPRTIEDVLEEYGSQVFGITTEEHDELIAKYADEIRGLMA